MSNAGIRMLSPRQAMKIAKKLIMAGRVPFIKSSPGLGKSSIYQQIADDLKLHLIDIRLSMLSPLDLNGMPRAADNGKATFLPFDIFPMVNDPIPKGKIGFLVLLDEFNSASQSVEAASYKILLDKYVGDKPLHENTYIALAGNLEDDRAITRPQSTATKLRVQTLRMHIDPFNKKHMEQFIEDVAYPRNWPDVIIGYLNFKPDHINTFKPDMVDETAAVPRTWEFAADMLMFDPDNINDLDLMGSILSWSVAASLKTYANTVKNLPPIAELLKDPRGYPLNDLSSQMKYGLITSMVSNTTEDNLKRMLTLVQRQEFGVEFKAMYVRSVNTLHKNKFAMNDDMIDAQATIQEHLNVGIE